MAFKVLSKSEGARVVLGERVWLTRDGKLVEDGHPDAASLYCAPGHSVLRADYEALLEASEPKAKPKADNKQVAAPKNKGKGE